MPLTSETMCNAGYTEGYLQKSFDLSHRCSMLFPDPAVVQSKEAKELKADGGY